MPDISPKKGDVISFQFVRNGLIGDGKTQVKVEGDMNYIMAKAIDPELNVKHQALFPYFRDAVNQVNDPTAYGYIGIINNNGQLEVIGIPWILASSFQYVQSRRAMINVTNWREEFRAPWETFAAGLGVSWTINTFEND
jgi:hypothetical protein